MNAPIRVTYTGFTPAAQTAFQSAVDIVSALVTSDVLIQIEASFTSLPPGVLGSAGPGQLIPLEDADGSVVLFPNALANDLVGFDIDAGSSHPGPEVEAEFSSAFTGWYFGTDGRPPSGTYDFKSVVLHEIWHGLGFTGSLEVDGSQGYWYFSDIPDNGTTIDLPMIYDLYAENAAGQALLNTSLFPNPSTALGSQLTGGPCASTATSPVAARTGSSHGCTPLACGPRAAATRTWTRAPTRPATATR